MKLPALPARLHRPLGWTIVALGIVLVMLQIRAVVSAKHGLPNIRHPIYWSKNLQTQARLNKSHAISSELASFYLIERLLRHTELTIEPSLEVYRWHLEKVSRTHVTASPAIVPVPAERWKDLITKTTRSGKLGKRMFYVIPEDGATRYVFVPTIGETDPLYIVSEDVYRSRVATNSGANLSAP